MKKHILPAIALLLVLAGCTTTPKHIPLPYHFVVGGLTDERSEDDIGNVAMMQAFPFVPGDFAASMQRMMPSNVFGSNDAVVYYALKHYEVTQYNGSYALSMVVGMKGVDSYGRALAAKDIACSEVAKEGFGLDTYVTQVMAQKSLEPLTMDGRTRTVWQSMYDACLRQLVNDYAQAVLTKSLGTGGAKTGGPERAHE